MMSAHVRCYINQRYEGKITSFNWTGESPRKEIKGIDCLEPFELAITQNRVSGSFTVVRAHLDGGAEGMGVTATSPIDERYFTLNLVDETTKASLFYAENCAVTNQSWSITPRGMVMGNINFVGVSWKNEASD